MIDERPRTLVILLVAVAAGLIGGLAFAWVASPVEYTSVEPSELQAEYWPTYLQLVSASFTFENDWTRASFRLAALREPEAQVARQVADVTERAIAEGRPAPMLRGLSKLSDRLGVRTAAMIIYLATPVPTVAPLPTPTALPLATPSPPPTPSPVPTFAPPHTPTPFPTFTPTPRPLPVYLLISNERVCEPGPPQIRVMIEDEKGQGLPGIEVWVTWEGGADRFVTGLKPERGAGYGDMDMRAGVAYDVAVAESALPLAQGLQTEQCPSADPTQPLVTSWLLTFRPVPPTPTPTVTPGPSPTLTPTLTSTSTLSTTITATRQP
jgi:hypothetical protein